MKHSTPIIWFIAISLAMPVCGYFCAIRPINQKRAELQQDIAARQATLVMLNRSLAAGSASGVKAESLRLAVADFEAKLPADGQMDKVLEDIWRMAQANSLQTKTVKTPAVQEANGYGEQTMELSLSGDFAGFYQFLLQLEDAKHVMRIKKMHLSKAGNRDGEMQADVTLSVYFEQVPRPL